MLLPQKMGSRSNSRTCPLRERCPRKPTNNHFGPFTVGGTGDHADFAWQVIAGADYYLNQKNSLFIEYKFLEYTGLQADFGNNRVLGQHLIGGGWRFHF